MRDWQSSSGPAVALRRAQLLQRAREYFDQQGVLHVDTPALSRAAGSDPNIDSMSVSSEFAGEFFLHTSPEFHMKRLLASGYPDIYSVCRVFRDGESGRRHLPEFTMLEWYRIGYGLQEIIDDTLLLIAAIFDDAALPATATTVDYADLLERHMGIDLHRAGLADLAAAAQADERLIRELDDDRDAWLDLILATRIVPQLPGDSLTVIRHYPASQAALARLCRNDNTVADRFEVFCGPIELANGYVELTDADEQSERMNRDIEIRATYNRREVARDEHLIDALREGLPPCSGVALGLERLHMAVHGHDTIDDVITFPTERA